MVEILVAAEIRLYREGLELALKREEQVDVTGTASNSGQALRRAGELRPDIVLLDVTMADTVPLIGRLAESAPDSKVVVIGVSGTEDDILPYAEAGVAGYVTRDASVADLIETLVSVAQGELRCSPRIAALLMNRVAALAAQQLPEPAKAGLTARELEILELIERGMSNKEIAGALGIELATVKKHVHNLLEKLRVRRRLDAATWARQQRVRQPLAKLG